MSIRLNKVIKEFNVGLQTVVDFLQKKGYEINAVPNEKVTDEQYDLLKKEFGADKDLRNKAEKMIKERKKPANKTRAPKASATEEIKTTIPENLRPRITEVGHIDLNKPQAQAAEPQPTPPAPAATEEKEAPAAEAPKAKEPTPKKEQTIGTLRSQVSRLQTDYANLKTAKMLDISSGEMKNAKARVSRLVREVDKCIALLNV